MNQFKRIVAFMLTLMLVFGSFVAVIASAEEKYLMGDVNDNGEIDTKDFAMVKMHYFDLLELTEEQQERADINGKNGIDTHDFAAIKMMYFDLMEEIWVTVGDNDPETPIDPEDPTDPSDPTDPEDPVDPEDPSSGDEEPVDPETPVEPANIASGKTYTVSDSAASANVLTDGVVRDWLTADAEQALMLDDTNTVDGIGTVVFDLGAKYDITGVNSQVNISTHVNSINWFGMLPLDSIVVYTSVDGVDYVELGTVTDMPAYNNGVEYEWANVTATASGVQYVKIEYVRDGSNKASVTEVQIWGTPSETSGDGEDPVDPETPYVNPNVPENTTYALPSFVWNETTPYQSTTNESTSAAFAFTTTLTETQANNFNYYNMAVLVPTETANTWKVVQYKSSGVFAVEVPANGIILAAFPWATANSTGSALLEIVKQLSAGTEVVITGLDVATMTVADDATITIPNTVEATNNITAGMSYTTSHISTTFPDENGASLTDGVYATDFSGGNAAWADFNSSRPEQNMDYLELGYHYITIDLGADYDLTKLELYYGFVPVAYVNVPTAIEFFYSADGENFTSAGSATIATGTENASSGIYNETVARVASVDCAVTARYVQVRIDTNADAFVSEFTAYGTAVAE